MPSREVTPLEPEVAPSVVGRLLVPVGAVVKLGPIREALRRTTRKSGTSSSAVVTMAGFSVDTSTVVAAPGRVLVGSRSTRSPGTSP